MAEQLQLKINGWAKWVSLLVTIIVLICSVVVFAARTDEKVCSLKEQVGKKVNQELYNNDIKYIREDLKEIKELIKAK